MELSTTKKMLGRNVYADCPVVVHRFSGLDAVTPAVLRADGLALLLQLLPGLKGHSDTCAVPDCIRQADESIAHAVPHLFEHIVVQLQNLAGCKLSCVRSGAEGQSRALRSTSAAVPFEDDDVEFAAAEFAVDLLNHTAAGDDATSKKSKRATTFDFTARLDEFLRFAAKSLLPIQDRFLIQTAAALDIPQMQLVGRIIQLGHGRHQQRLSATKTSHTNIVSNDLAANKDYTQRLLDDLGLPVPRSERVYRKRDIAEAAKLVGGYPVVVKPNNGSMGGGVSVGMKSEEEALDAYDRARKVARSVLVEEVVPGADFRMVIINGELCAAAERVPGHVVGDGKSTVEELVDEINRDPRRGDGPTQSWTRLTLDDQADRLLSELGYDHQSALPAGDTVFLRRNANTSDGGTAVDVTDDVHPDNRAIAVRAAKAIGLDIAGVDILTTDISKSMWKTGGKICEINSRPGLRKHLWPHTGKRRDVATPILDMLFPPGQLARVPVVAVTGSGDTRTAARMLEHYFSSAGHHVGLLLNRRIYSGGQASSRRKLTPAEGMRMIFLDPEVDLAVVELSPKEVLRYGLGCDAIDVTAVIEGVVESDDAESSNVKSAKKKGATIQDGIAVVTRATRTAVFADVRNPITDADIGETASLLRVHAGGAPSTDLASEDGDGRHVSVDHNSISIHRGTQLEVKIPMVEVHPGADDEGNDEVEQRLKDGGLFASVCAYTLGADPKDVFRSLSSYSRPSSRGAKKRSDRTKA